MEMSPSKVLSYIEARMRNGFLAPDRENMLYFIKLTTCAVCVSVTCAFAGAALTFMFLSPQIQAAEQQNLTLHNIETSILSHCQ